MILLNSFYISLKISVHHFPNHIATDKPSTESRYSINLEKGRCAKYYVNLLKININQDNTSTRKKPRK